MVALKGKAITDFLKKRPSSCCFIVIYGNDSGMVRERSDIIGKQVVDDLQDAFNAVELTPAALKEQPGLLADEAAALSFMGGQRLVRVRGNEDAVGKASKILLDAVDAGSFEPNAVIIIEAGALRKTAALRKLAENHKRAAALPCYEDSAADLASYIQDALAGENLTIDQEALGQWMQSLPPDRGILRAELEKLILFKGPKEIRNDNNIVSLEDVRHCLADSASEDSFALGDLLLGGKAPALAHAMHRASAAGTSPLGWLRLVQLSTLKLYAARKAMDEGLPSSTALQRQGIVFPAAKQAEQHLRKWPAPRLEQALKMLAEAELDAKQTGVPSGEIIERTALRLAVMAGR